MVETRKRKRGGRIRMPSKIAVRNSRRLINTILDRYNIQGDVREFLIEDSPMQSSRIYYVIDMEDNEPEIEAGGLTQREITEGYEFRPADSHIVTSNNRIDIVEMYPVEDDDDEAGRPTKRHRSDRSRSARRTRKRKRRH